MKVLAKVRVIAPKKQFFSVIPDGCEESLIGNDVVLRAKRFFASAQNDGLGVVRCARPVARVLAAAWVAISVAPGAEACSVCFGEAGSPQTAGMKMAMLTLLGVTGVVLSGAGGFSYVLWKRGAFGETRKGRDDE